MDEERRKARRELGLYDRIITSGRSGWAKALGVGIIVALALLGIWLG